jgi:FAD/FMN-containing dehydrogenase
MTSLINDTFHALGAELGSALFLPSDPDWDDARSAWVASADLRPAAVVLAETADHVCATVRFAAESNVRVTAQGTGHNAAALGDLADTILLKTSRMRGITVDPVRRIARVEAGVLWAELTAATSAHGLVGLLGSSPDVGVVGYVLGGGHSWLGRAYGLASNSVESIEVVTADGRLRRVDATHDSDLFWALRGGGGNFGIVTALELRLVPMTHVYAGALFWPIERGHEVWTAWSEWVHTLPETMTTWARFMRFPDFPEIPEPLRSNAFVIVEVTSAGEAADADAVLAPMRMLAPVMDTMSTMPMTALSKVHMDPEQPVPAAGEGMMLAEFNAETAAALVAVAGADSGSPLLSLEVRHLGGALAREPKGAGALSRFVGSYLVYGVGITPVPAAAAAVHAATTAMRAALAPWDSGSGYLNFTERNAGPEYFFAPDVLARLRKIKDRYDPQQRIRGNHELSPRG